MCVCVVLTLLWLCGVAANLSFSPGSRSRGAVCQRAVQPHSLTEKGVGQNSVGDARKIKLPLIVCMHIHVLV